MQIPFFYFYNNSNCMKKLIVFKILELDIQPFSFINFTSNIKFSIIFKI